MLRKTPPRRFPSLAIQTFNPSYSSSSTPAFESNKRAACKSWLIEPTSVLDIRSPSPTCTSLSSFLRSSSCEGAGLLLPKGEGLAVSDHGDPLPDFISLIEGHGSTWSKIEETSNGTCETNGIISSSADMAMAKDCTHAESLEHISDVVGTENPIDEGSSFRVIRSMASGRDAMAVLSCAGASFPSFPTMQSMKQQGNNMNSNMNGHVQEMQKKKSLKEGGSSSSQCSEGYGNQDQNMMAMMMMMMMQKLDHQQHSSLSRSSEDQWLNPDYNSLSGCEFGAGDPEKGPLVAMDDLESMLLSSSPPPPPPDQSLMKLLFGEGEDISNSLLLQPQQQLNNKQANLSGLPQQQQQMQLDLQEAMEAHFTSSCGINPQPGLSPSLPFSDPHLSCPSSPTFPSMLPFYACDQYNQQPTNLPLPHDTSLPVFPQQILAKDANLLPLSCASTPLESKRACNQAKLLPSSSIKSPPYSPTLSPALYSRNQKLMMEKLSMSALPRLPTTPSCQLSSLPSVGDNYMQHELVMQRKRLRGAPQAEEFLQKAVPWLPVNADQNACSKVGGMQGRGEMKRVGAQWVQRGKVNTEEMHVMGVDQLLKAAEAVELGNRDMAHAILARLNHQQYLAWPHHGKPLQRAAFYFKDALLNLLNNTHPGDGSTARASPLDILNKITAYISFCESSLLPQFAHFTSNQAILEAMEGENCIHLIDFELGLGGQWASFLQEIAAPRSNTQGPPKVKLTTIGVESIELQLIRENLYEFGSRLSIPIHLQLIPVAKLDILSCSMLGIEEGDAIAINFGSGLSCILDKFSTMDTLTAFLQLIKALSPKVITVMELQSECYYGFSFSRRFLYSLEYYASLFASLESTTGLPMEEVLKIEKLLFAPKIMSSLTERRRNEKLLHWHNLFTELGFFPLVLTPAAETQAECIIQSPQACNKGFHVSKRQGSLLLEWHDRTLISASAWSC